MGTISCYYIEHKGCLLSSSGVERSAVNRFVVGSNPTWGDYEIKCVKFNHFY